MLTLFSVPKSFEGKYVYIQENAIRSWIESIHPRPEIILLGKESGIKEICKKYNLIHIPHIKVNSFGTPLLDDIFKKSCSKASNELMVYVNSDIIFTENLYKIVSDIEENTHFFLASGRRYEMPIQSFIGFTDSEWGNRLRNKCNKNNLKNSAWLDYFVFPKGLFHSIPPFALGRTFWDKWLVWKASTQNHPIIDLTERFHPIHQSHGYGFDKNNVNRIWEGREAIENIRLAGGWSHGCTLDSVKGGYKNKLVNLFKKIIDKLPFIWPFLLKVRRFVNKV